MALGGMGLGGGPVSNGAAAGEEVVAPWEKIPGPPVVPIFARQTKLDRKGMYIGVLNDKSRCQKGLPEHFLDKSWVRSFKVRLNPKPPKTCGW